MIHSARANRGFWLALLLPLFVLRSLIPMGFMPMFGPGYSVSLMLCDGYAPVPHPSMAMDMPMDASLNVSMDDSGQSAESQHGRFEDSSGRSAPAQQNHSACPYGASPVLAGAAALAVVSLALGLQPEPVLPAPQLTVFQSIARAQSPRAPPIHS